MRQSDGAGERTVWNEENEGSDGVCEAVDRCLIYYLTTLSVVEAVDIWRRILWWQEYSDMEQE